jgi:hypothetical protein
MLVVVEISSALDDAPIAQTAYDALLPYAELPIMASLAVVCFGSTHRGLGVAAMTCGKLDLALEHFAAAVVASERLGHRPAAILAKAELGLAHLRRGGRDDVPRGRTLLQQAMVAGEGVGMSGLVARWREAGARVEPAAARHEAHPARMTLVQTGRWRVVHGGHVATVPDRIGMRYLSQLVAAPDQAIPALALVVQGVEAPATGSGDALMDRKAMVEVRERIRELRQQGSLAPSEQDELEMLTQELAHATGLGGRIRSFADAPERARTAVRKAIKRAIDEISLANPVVGRHLSMRIETGAVCRYRMESAPSQAP